MDKDRAAELLEALEIANTLRLRHQMELLQQNKPLSNEIETNSLGKIERDLLKESFKIVNDFKKIISYIFKLDKIY